MGLLIAGQAFGAHAQYNLSTADSNLGTRLRAIRSTVTVGQLGVLIAGRLVVRLDAAAHVSRLSPGAYPPPDDFDYNSGVYVADHRSTRRDAHHALTTVGAAVFIMVRSSDLVRGYASPPFRPAMIMWESRCLFTRGSGARIVDIDYGLNQILLIL
jgi:hypothetical protein